MRRQMLQQPSKHARLWTAGTAFALLASGCAPVGPDFTAPVSGAGEEWVIPDREAFLFQPQDTIEWWTVFNDPVLDNLVDLAHKQNNNIRLAGLRVIEARAVLGIATGNKYPQSQAMLGDATALQVSQGNANTAAGPDLNYTQYNLSAGAAWEIDFWGRFRRGIESADANLLASIASYDDTLVLLAAQVADTYTVIRTNQEQLRLAHQDLALQQRSYEIVDVLFRFGASNELDAQQAETLLLSTKATIPSLEAAINQGKNALSTLLGMPPGSIDGLLVGKEDVPDLPKNIAVGVPADMLRQRPDIRRAELQAMAQNAQVGVATANLYPSFSISGTIGLSAAGGTDTTLSGSSGLDALFSPDSLTYAIGPSFVWPFLNYGRIKNSIRVEDARLQQALVQYRETVLQAAREVEDAMVAYNSSQLQDELLGLGVASAIRSSDLSMLRYKEGFADYQRVLDAQQRLFTQQQRYIANKGFAVQSVIALYRSLGGGWQAQTVPFVDEDTKQQMQDRIDWDDYLDADRTTIRENNDSPISEQANYE